MPKAKVPIVVAELLPGIAVGPDVLDWAHTDDLIEALATLGVAFLFFIVAITEIGTETGRMKEEDAVALIGAGILSLLIYPLIGLALLRRRGAATPPSGNAA